MNVDPIQGDIILNENPVKEAFNAAVGDAKQWKLTTAQVMEQAGQQGGQGFFKSLKGELGKGSELGQTLKMMMGGGAIAAAGMAGNELAAMTGKMAALMDSTNSLKMNAADVTMELGKSLPVLGGIFTAGENINEMFTGEKSAIAQANEEIKAQQELFDRLGKDAKTYRDAIHSMQEELAKLQGEKVIEGNPAADAAKKAVQDKINALAEPLHKAMNERAALQELVDRNKNFLTHEITLPGQKTRAEKLAEKELEIAAINTQIAILRAKADQQILVANKLDAEILKAKNPETFGMPMGPDLGGEKGSAKRSPVRGRISSSAGESPGVEESHRNAARAVAQSGAAS